MSDFDWSEIHMQSLREDPEFNLNVPIDALPGEAEEDTFFRYLREENILVGEDLDDLYVDWERAEAVNPNIMRFLKACQLSDVDNMLAEMEEMGVVYSTVVDGELVWGLTEKGNKYVEEMHSEDN